MKEVLWVTNVFNEKRAVCNLAMTWKQPLLAQDSFISVLLPLLQQQTSPRLQQLGSASVWNKEGKNCFHFQFRFVPSPFNISVLKNSLNLKTNRINWFTQLAEAWRPIQNYRGSGPMGLALVSSLLKGRITNIHPPMVKMLHGHICVNLLSTMPPALEKLKIA